jgi:ribosome modulation factor
MELIIVTGCLMVLAWICVVHCIRCYQAFSRGYNAGVERQSGSDNPYHAGSILWHEWTDGYELALLHLSDEFMLINMSPTEAYDDDGSDDYHQPYLAFNQGYEAADQGIDASRNPYPEDEIRGRWWADGYETCVEQLDE